MQFTTNRVFCWASALVFLCRALLAVEGIREENDPKFVSGSKTGRGYITHKLESAPGGAYLTVEVVQDRTRSKVKLRLGLDGPAGSPSNPHWLLTSGVPNPSGYRTKFEFYLDYEKLRKLLKSRGIANSDERINAGKNLVVFADFPSGHRWGGTDRSGVFRLPAPTAKANANIAKVTAEAPKLPGFGEGPPATALDIAQGIDKPLAEEFAPLRGRGGLEVGGQVRSRVEAEGKFQLDPAEFLKIREDLFDLAANRQLQSEVLGEEWSIKVIKRYMRKDRSGRLLRDADGFLMPDPMIDTYYDTRNLDAAKNDIAIRYRWTANNKTGAWNFKPGVGRRTDDGIVYRVEYGVDTVDNRPESVEVFANSTHPLNPFQLLRETVPGVSPGKFFEPSIQLVDYRYKFALIHKSGAEIEVSLDKVEAERLTKNARAGVTFYQLEMDVEHVSTKVKSVAQPEEPTGNGPVSPYATLHKPSDVNEQSPTLETQRGTFELASEVIVRLRDHVIGKNWRPGAQKYAFAAAALGAIRPQSSSSSVKALGFQRGECAALIEKIVAKR